MNTSATPAGSPREIFLAALDIEDPQQRQAYLNQACGSDAERRGRVSQLLAAHAAGAASLLDEAIEQLAPDATVLEGETASDAVLCEGEVIDRYKLREQIGEGGMGIVYVAEQTEPVRRQVALKVIKPGMDSKVVVTRFEAERQALALMDHPNVARVIDAGTTQQGRPYFVMELVRGFPITEYCDQAGLDIRQRLELFVRVCQAVQHAHQKGIIHRDLKPSNVMVTLHDGVPVPKVIDFGVAKALNQKLTEQTIYTQHRQLIGTPAYMSPEQAEMSGLDIDTRSDVYSLGVLLYELLTGTTPFEKQTLKALSFDEMRRVIREQDPPRPSQRISTFDAAADSTLQQQRGIDRRQLSQSLRRELDWIVMRALEKDRNRRYESASALADDVQRYLDDEPVEACPPTLGYRLRKFAARHIGLLTTIVLILAMAIIGSVISLQYASKATSAADATRAAMTEAQNNLNEIQRQRQLAEQKFDEARDAIRMYLAKLNRDEMLEGPSTQSLRMKLLELALEYHLNLAEQRTSGSDLELELAAALRRLDAIHEQVGQLEKGPLDFPARTLFGPDGRFYVANVGHNTGAGSVDVFDPTTGEHIEEFVEFGSGGLDRPADMTFGPDGHLYIPSYSGAGSNRSRIARYDGTTGAYLGDFVQYGAGGVDAFTGITFGPDVDGDSEPDLFASSARSHRVLVYSGADGSPLGIFVSDGAGGLDSPGTLQFRDLDGDGTSELLVSSRLSASVIAYNGRDGSFLYEFANVFAQADRTEDFQFGPDGDLYITARPEIRTINGGDSRAQVLRCDGQTGAFVGLFVPPDAGGYSSAAPRMTFDRKGDLLLNSGDTNQILRFKRPNSADSGQFVDVFVDGINFLLITARDINSAGQIVGAGYPLGIRNVFGRRAAYLYTPPRPGDRIGRVVELDVPGFNFEEEATALNDDGDVGGHFRSEVSGNMHAFLWTPEDGVTDLGTLAGADTLVTDISARRGGRLLVFGYALAGGGKRRWRYTTSEGAMQDLGPLRVGGESSFSWHAGDVVAVDGIPAGVQTGRPQVNSAGGVTAIPKIHYDSGKPASTFTPTSQDKGNEIQSGGPALERRPTTDIRP